MKLVKHVTAILTLTSVGLSCGSDTVEPQADTGTDAAPWVFGACDVEPENPNAVLSVVFEDGCAVHRFEYDWARETAVPNYDGVLRTQVCNRCDDTIHLRWIDGAIWGDFDVSHSIDVANESGAWGLGVNRTAPTVLLSQANQTYIPDCHVSQYWAARPEQVEIVWRAYFDARIYDIALETGQSYEFETPRSVSSLLGPRSAGFDFSKPIDVELHFPKTFKDDEEGYFAPPEPLCRQYHPDKDLFFGYPVESQIAGVVKRQIDWTTIEQP